MIFFSLYNLIQSQGIWYQLETATVTSSIQTQAIAEEMQAVLTHKVFTFSFFCCSLSCKTSIFECKYKIWACIWKMWLVSMHLHACMLFSLINGTVILFSWFLAICLLYSEKMVSKDFAGKQNFARRHWKVHLFNQLNTVIDSYPYIICKPFVKTQQKPYSPLLSVGGSWSCTVHVSRGFF